MTAAGSSVLLLAGSPMAARGRHDWGISLHARARRPPSSCGSPFLSSAGPFCLANGWAKRREDHVWEGLMGWVCRGPTLLRPQTPCPCGPGQHWAPPAPRCREAGSCGCQRQRESLVVEGSSGLLHWLCPHVGRAASSLGSHPQGPSLWPHCFPKAEPLGTLRVSVCHACLEGRGHFGWLCVCAG